MKISRRKVVVLGASAVSASLLPINLLAQSDGQSAEDIIKFSFLSSAVFSQGIQTCFPFWFTNRPQASSGYLSNKYFIISLSSLLYTWKTSKR